MNLQYTFPQRNIYNTKKAFAKTVQVKSKCGKIIQFPADKMREFVLREGVRATFIMLLDDENKFLSIRRLRWWLKN